MLLIQNTAKDAFHGFLYSLLTWFSGKCVYEMDLFYKKLANTPKSKTTFGKIRKEWWMDELTEIAKAVHGVEGCLCE